MADDGLSRHEKIASVALLNRIIDDDRYPLSPRISVLRGILAKLELPKPVPAPLPPLKVYASPRHSVGQRRARRCGRRYIPNSGWNNRSHKAS